MSLMPAMAEPVVDATARAALERDTPRRALFLDRDGVVNVDHGYVHTAQETQWMPGIFELVGRAHAAGVPTIVVTNQAGIARGYYDEAQFRAYTKWQHAQFRERGTPLLATYFCPHHPQPGEGRQGCVCGCRKPAPGMLQAAIETFAIDPAQALLIGDKPSDIEAARSAGLAGSFLVQGTDLNDAMAWLTCREEIAKWSK